MGGLLLKSATARSHYRLADLLLLPTFRCILNPILLINQSRLSYLSTITATFCPPQHRSPLTPNWDEHTSYHPTSLISASPAALHQLQPPSTITKVFIEPNGLMLFFCRGWVISFRLVRELSLMTAHWWVSVKFFCHVISFILILFQ